MVTTSSAAAPLNQLLPTQLSSITNCHDFKNKSTSSVLLLSPKGKRTTGPVARLIGPAIFEVSKLKVLRLGADERQHPESLPRTYTLTHSDITANLTLAISNTVNHAQFSGWYSKLQRDEVVAEWKKVKGKMSLHVHCHISGGHFLLDLIANLRYYIFSKELPVVLNAFMHGDSTLFMNYPELAEAMVYVYFESNIPQFHKVQCWGPLREAALRGRSGKVHESSDDYQAFVDDPSSGVVWPQRCQTNCKCCFPHRSIIPWPHDFLQEPQRQPEQQPQ